MATIVLGFYAGQILDVRLFNPSLHGPWTLFGDGISFQIMVSWEYKINHFGAIQYGLEKDHLNEFKYLLEPETLVHMNLTALIANTTYYYQIGYVDSIESVTPESFKSLTTQIFQFTTLSDLPSEGFKFLAISDTQQIGAGNAFSRRVGKYLGTIAENYAFITIVGDLTENGKQQSYWNDWFDFSSPYLGKTVLVPVTGNHDMGFPSGNPTPEMKFRQYFPISKSQNHFFYSFNYSQLHMLILDFTWPTEYEFSAEQLNWLNNDLQSAESMPFIVVAFHCPIHDSGAFGNNPMLQSQLRPILDYYNVTVILNGHDHHYERVEEFGLTYIVLGGGGAIQDPIITPIAETKLIALGPNYSELEINSTNLTVNVYTLQQELIDSVIFQSRLDGGGH